MINYNIYTIRSITFTTFLTKTILIIISYFFVRAQIWYLNMSIAVLIPCYNEANTIKKVVDDFRKILPEADIYVYDNNSTDNTVENAKNSQGGGNNKVRI